MEKKIFCPILYNCNGDINGRWFVWYYDQNGKRIKVYKLRADDVLSLNAIKNVAKRYEYAERIKQEIRNLTEAASQINNKQSNSCPADIVGIFNVILNGDNAKWRRKTELQYMAKINIFSRFVKRKDLNNFSEANALSFHKYLIDKGLSNVTVNSYKVILGNIWNLALKLKLLSKPNPFNCLPNLRENMESCRPYNKAQLKELKTYISAKNPMLWLCCQFLYYCYIRPGELRLLKIGDIDIERGVITVRGSISKNKKTEVVVIPKPFLAVLQQYKISQLETTLYVIGTKHIGSKQPIGTNWIGARHRKVLKTLGYEVGVHNYTFYGYKHTSVINAVLGGMPLVQLQRQLRHSSLEQMKNYMQKLGIMDCKDIRDNFPEL